MVCSRISCLTHADLIPLRFLLSRRKILESERILVRWLLRRRMHDSRLGFSFSVSWIHSLSHWIAELGGISFTNGGWPLLGAGCSSDFAANRRELSLSCHFLSACFKMMNNILHRGLCGLNNLLLVLSHLLVVVLHLLDRKHGPSTN